VYSKTILTFNLFLACIAAIEVILLFGLPGFSQETNEALFKSKCAMCHGPAASGKTAMGDKLKIPDLRTTQTQKKSDADLKNMIANGKDKMPGYKTKLTATQIDGLVVYIRSLGKKS
jgi:mono/diheme cytochrome c family protein